MGILTHLAFRKNSSRYRSLKWEEKYISGDIGLLHMLYCHYLCIQHDGVIKWKHFSRYWPFVSGIHRSPVDSPHKGQWYGTAIFSLICAWTNGWANTRETGDLRRRRAHHDVTVMMTLFVGITKVGGKPRYPSQRSCRVYGRYQWAFLLQPSGTPSHLGQFACRHGGSRVR